MHTDVHIGVRARSKQQNRKLLFQRMDIRAYIVQNKWDQMEWMAGGEGERSGQDRQQHHHQQQ